jgi:hypothetical protein
MNRRLVLAVRPDEENRRGENGKDLIVTKYSAGALY